MPSLAITGLLGWLFIPWGYSIDRHRTTLARSHSN
jgi:hypothetical protein